MVMNAPKNGKKKGNLLSLINFNIQKTNQKLNNPDQFYNNYFASILEGEIEKKNKTNKNSPNFLANSILSKNKRNEK